MKYLLSIIFVLLAQIAMAADYYVGPIGTPAGNGTQQSPFSSINAAVSSGRIVGGDRLLLLDGYYGEFGIKSFAPTSTVTIQAVNPGKAVFESIEVNWNARNLTFSGLTITWTKGPAKPRTGWLFYVSPETRNISITDSTLMAHPDSANFRNWTLEEWTARSFSGITMRTGGGQILRNRIIGIAFGISVDASDVLIEGNTVDGFSHDGLRGIGNRLVFRNNRVSNCVQINGNHADGFQSFNLSRTGAFFDGIVLENNTIIEQTGARMPLACLLQGIGMFDGMFSNLTIKNNYVEVSAYHGITVTGVVGVVIDNNKVYKSPDGKHTPWIMVVDHKDGRKSSNVVISNNVVADTVRGPFAPGINNVKAGAVPLPPALVLSGKMTLAEMCLLVKP